MRRSLSLVAPIALASCVAPPQPAPAPQPSPVPLPAPTPTPTPVAGPDWRDWPYTPGDWVYRQDARGSVALFGPPGGDALLIIRCDRTAGAIYLSRSGLAPSGTPMLIRSTEQSRAIATQPTGAVPPYMAATIARSDPLLDAIGFSRGRFVIEQAGLATLVIPPWPEFERVVQDCRGGV